VGIISLITLYHKFFQIPTCFDDFSKLSEMKGAEIAGNASYCALTKSPLPINGRGPDLLSVSNYLLSLIAACGAISKRGKLLEKFTVEHII
jgi:hypothetical protein